MASQNREDEHIDGRRTREVYRFFRPERPALRSLKKSFSSEIYSPPVSNADGTLSAPVSPALLPQPSLPANFGPVSSLLPEGLTLGEPNTTLTSFAHLAALRLNVERVLISVSNRTSQFIIAQSTQFFRKPSDFDSLGDGVWDGCFTLSSRSWRMCKDTIELPPSDREAGEYKFVVVNDLGEDERYRELPFVKGDPKFRFYAGTPLTTDTKINIGSFFVLDKKPRPNGLDDTEREVLGSLGMLIMDYLRVSRQASEGRRAARLSRGLSCFVEGSSSFVESPQQSYAGSAVPGTPSSSNLRAHHLSVGSLNSFELPSQRSQSNDARSFSSASDYRADQCVSSAPDTQLPDWWAGSRHKVQEESHGNTWAFRRAANLLRESLELEDDGGVMFLEAVNSPVMSDIDTGSDCSGFGEASNPAPVLAISTTDEPFAPCPGSTVLYPATNLEGGFLQQLLRRYAKGKLWSFHRDGLLTSSDDEKPPRARSSRATKSPDFSRGSSKKWRAFENSMLNLYFPNATQVMFVPLWNAANSQWFGGCFCWNTVETRVFNPSVELSSILGFGSSIMAECNRVESLISDRQKGDFIGSISHELRSPLHGILAAAEFLSATQLDEFQGSLLETINACGRTLLDTMNQVLDFSKIVSLEKSWRHMRRGRASSDSKPLEKISAHLDTYMATDIALLAEEVVEGVCLGHSYGQRSTATYGQSVLLSNAATLPANLAQDATQPRSGVEVIVDVAPNDWTYLSQPGALRRIIMNLFGNAMKYTEAGRVSLHLEVAEMLDGRSRRQDGDDLVTLTVSDTGKGISEEFLRGRLYTPFAQEDTLAVGTGLGLSIVRSLVRSLSGSINIHSRPGEGTTVKVSIPLARIEAGDPFDTTLDTRTPSPRERQGICESLALGDAHAGRRAAIFGLSPEAAAEHPLWSTVSRYLTDWYGLELVSWPSDTPTDIVLIDDASLSEKTCQTLYTLRHLVPALLILCNQSIDHNQIQSQYASLAQVVKIIHRPCGPQKLAQSIRRCLESQLGSATTTPEQIALPKRPHPRTFMPPPEPEKTTSEAKASNSSYSVTDLTTDSGSSVASSSMGAQSPGQEIEQPLPTIISPLSFFQGSPPQPELVSESPKLEEKQSTPAVTAAEPPEPRKARVLVVDDNSINLNLMLTFMKKRNLDTLEAAENGKLAVEAVERLSEGYDLIFMDMSMPVMDGFEATRAIRSLEKERDGESAIIIALTGLSSSRDESDALASGVDLFLTKPVSFKEVSRLLEEWEGNRLRERCT
ncbi:putative sensor histidine kinase/response regulator [Aspergillus affinis]|uniref:putative sensor histidine kinase/response regulator n=1 Tax=Aspergillus affinis TaxID=1070780 RepID=UPI0022FED1EC|nr:two-component sensor protein histidine protein kinase [Aspergillus affinis]KAI9041309.1 two-component sensor protein histidine protein kinase [Aspergillus affinis]